MNNFYSGSLVKCSAEFKNSAGTLVDPTTVKFQFLAPNGQSDEYIYGTDTELVKTGTGAYYVYLPVDAVGVWNFRFAGSGVVGRSATQGQFNVYPVNV